MKAFANIRNGLDVVNYLLHGHQKDYVLLYIYAVLSSLLEVASIGLIFPLIQMVVGPSDTIVGVPDFLVAFISALGLDASITRVSLFLIVVFSFKNLFRFGVNYGSEKIMNSVREAWMNRLFEKYLSSHYLFFVNTRHGALIYNLFGLTTETARGLRELVQMFMSGISTIIILTALFFLSWQVTLVSIVLLIAVYMGVNRRMMIKTASLGKMHLSFQQLADVLPLEAFRGIREIKVYLAKRPIVEEYAHLIRRMMILKNKIV